MRIVQLINNTQVKKLLAFLLLASIVAGISYYMVFEFPILPKGYSIVEMQNNSMTLQSYNIAGIERDIATVSFSEEDTWKIAAIEHEIKRQKEFLWLLYFAVMVSIFLFFYKVRNSMKVWKAILDSNLIFSFLIPLSIISNSLDRIQHLMS
ncbi:hypothetical protein [Gracilibacillus salinarum]|uniref:Uncharacterized protein n=1 Tax=Gracilibacillus salinarum TaxID=2932255 RepID=A0ABY4GGV8_9BACI|nr:hypothetical protein [Gracilibacillus salinarum]UOQ83445.1 hypothetical protein MUN87_11800 [Gracilibacillus salinarum]